MVITAANVGDIIRIDQNAVHIQVEAVTEKYVHYRQETGDNFATFEHNIQGSVVLDPNRIQEFRRNITLGTALRSAELSAIRHLLDSQATREQHMDATSVLASVKGMKMRLSERISQREARDTGKQPAHRSLDAIISKASADGQAKQQSQAMKQSRDFDR